MNTKQKSYGRILRAAFDGTKVADDFWANVASTIIAALIERETVEGWRTIEKEEYRMGDKTLGSFGYPVYVRRCRYLKSHQQDEKEHVVAVQETTVGALSSGSPAGEPASASNPAENIQCPVCGYYCLGKGGHGCIDKPSLQQGPTPKVAPDTPRTDEAIRKFVWNGVDHQFVEAHFTRQLERELTKAKNEIETLNIRHGVTMLHGQSVVDEANSLRSQLTEAQEKLKKFGLLDEQLSSYKEQWKRHYEKEYQKRFREDTETTYNAIHRIAAALNLDEYDAKDVADAACAALHSTASLWIPCSERMPTKEDALNGKVVVAYPTEFPYIGICGYLALAKSTTHWMPIPPMPPAPEEDAFEKWFNEFYQESLNYDLAKSAWNAAIAAQNAALCDGEKKTP